MTLAVKSSSSYMSVVRDAVHITGVIDSQRIIAIMLVAPLSVSMHGGGGGGGGGDDGGGGSGAEPGG